MPSDKISTRPVLAGQVYGYRPATTSDPAVLIAIHRWSVTPATKKQVFTVTYTTTGGGAGRFINVRQLFGPRKAAARMNALRTELSARGQLLTSVVDIRDRFEDLTGARAVHCTACGHPMIVGAVYCDWCGTEVPSTPIRAAVPAPPS